MLYRLTGVVLDTDTQVDFTEQERVYIAPAMTWRPTAGTSFTLLGQYLKEDSVPNIGFLPAVGTLLPGPEGKFRRSVFTGEPGYPVDLQIAPATSQNRLTILFRLILAIPAAIVVNVLQNVAWIVAFLGWFYALFTGRMSKGMRDLLAYCTRYQAQTYGYLLLLTQRYPSFSDE